MTTKPNSGTVSVSRELLPCPFCGSSDVKIVTDDGIHFAQCCKCEATGPTGFKRGEEDDADWNNRAQPADQQGEPVAWQWRRKTVQEGSQWTAWTDCAKGDYEACIASPQPSVRGIIREARRLYAAQPATAKVVLPRRLSQDDGFSYEAAEWFNACLDEVARLNGIET